MKDRASITITTVANGYIVEPPPRYVADAPVTLSETLVFEQLDHLVQWMRVHLRKPEQSVEAVKQEQPDAGPLNARSWPSVPFPPLPASTKGGAS